MGGKTKRGVEVAQGLGYPLTRQTMHEIKVDRLEPCRMGRVYGGTGLGSIVDAAESLERGIVETLYSQ